jgi:hypothetical protein
MASATCRLVWPAACRALMRAKVGGSMGVRPSARQKVFRGRPRLAFVAGSGGLPCAIRTLSHTAARVCHCRTLSTTRSQGMRVSLAVYEHSVSPAGHTRNRCTPALTCAELLLAAKKAAYGGMGDEHDLCSCGLHMNTIRSQPPRPGSQWFNRDKLKSIRPREPAGISVVALPRLPSRALGVSLGAGRENA